MNSVLAAGLIWVVFLLTMAIWSLRLSINPPSVRYLAALICTFGQVILEVSLTFPASPLQLSDIPILHFIALVGIALSSSNLRRSAKSHSLVNFHSFRQFTTTDLLKRKDILIYFPFITAAIIIGMFVSLFGGPSAVDERAYHWPQVLAIIQNNGMTTFDSSLPWTYSYPLGKAQVASFTWPFLGNDYGFRAPQAFYALLSILGIYSIGSHFSKRIGLIASLLMVSSPVFATQLRMLSDDLGYGAFTIACVAFLVRAILESENKTKMYLFAFGLISYAIAGQFKFPIVASLLCAPLVLGFLFQFKKERNFAIISISMVLFATLITFVYSIRNFFQTGNPFFPMTIKIKERVLFSGPLISIDNSSAKPSSTFDLEEPLRYLKLWHATFFDFFQPPNEDSLGGYNYLVGSFLLVLLIIALFQIRQLPSVHQMLLITSFCIVVFVPAMFLPRYGFYLMAILSIFALKSLPLKSLSTRKLTTMFLFIFLGLIPIIISNIQTTKWVSSQIGSQQLLKNGGSSIEQKYDLSDNGTTLPATYVKWIHENVRENDVVCYSAATNYPSLFWNVDRKSKVKYTPIEFSDRYPNSNNPEKVYPNSILELWLRSNSSCDYIFGYDFRSYAKVELGLWSEVQIETTDEFLFLKKAQK
jgi:hypothetical protein